MEIKFTQTRYQLKWRYSPRLKFLMECQRFVQNLMHTNRLCYHTKFNISYITMQLKFSCEVVTMEYGSHSQGYLYLTSIEGLKISPKASRVEQKLVLDKTQYSRANHVVRISIQVYFSRILMKVNFGSNFKGQNAKWPKLALKTSVLVPIMFPT